MVPSEDELRRMMTILEEEHSLILQEEGWVGDVYEEEEEEEEYSKTEDVSTFPKPGFFLFGKCLCFLLFSFNHFQVQVFLPFVFRGCHKRRENCHFRRFSRLAV